ncbi:MAG: hypothetical protein KatS3mg038_2599 [Candidatus Kapaibacterium sp.]|nr:MAG: hypothetical protein KatS3mg038_2599 [Candidatus Kapabacteria bacterium]
MADVYAIANGNWNDPAIWSSGSVPGTVDNVWLNGKTITLDQDISVASLSSEANATLGTVAGGTLDIPSTYSTRSVTASGDIRQGGTTNLVRFARSTTLTISCTTLYSSDVSGTNTIQCTSTSGIATINITANVIARASNVIGTFNDYTILTINGSIWSTGTGAVIAGNLLLTSSVINGNIKNGAINFSSNVNLTVNGNLINDSSLTASAPIRVSSGNGSLTINGNVIAGAATGLDLNLGWNNPFTLTINGNVYGGSSVDKPGIMVSQFQSNHKITINGDVYAGTASLAPGLRVRDITGGNIFLNGNMRVQNGGSLNTPAVSSSILAISNAQTRYIEHWEGDIGTGQPTGNKLIFETNINASQANPADVRQGVVYGPAGEYTGTCAVPPPQSVAYGVPVDNTVGQAGLPPYRAVAEYRGG